MAKHLFLLGVFLLSGSSFFGSEAAFAAGPTIITENITEPTIWAKEGSPYIVKKTIYTYAPLTIEPGVVVKFSNSYIGSSFSASLLVTNSFTAVGTKDERIIFTSVCDDAFGGNTRSFTPGCYPSPSRGEWGGILTLNNPNPIAIEHAAIWYANRGFSYTNNNPNIRYRNAIIRNTEIRRSFWSAIYVRNTEPTIESDILAESRYYGIEVRELPSDMTLMVRNSSIVGNGIGLYADRAKPYAPYPRVDARDNWWGDPSGPYYPYTNRLDLPNPDGTGNPVIGNLAMFRPWLTGEPAFPSETTCVEDCHSNVLFLPGLKASRLYTDGALGAEDQLWLPTLGSDDIEQLAMDDDGESIGNVYTKDVLGEVGIPLIGGNIYKSFLGDLETLRSEGTINDYRTFAYDWRHDVADIARGGTAYPDGIVRSLIDDTLALAASSKSGRVSIVTHSNGGLLGKALMLALAEQGKTDLVDRIVFVGVPQEGTPLAVLSMLYGYDEPISGLMSRSEARSLAETMPGAYGLLPSRAYFGHMDDPFIRFVSERTRYDGFRRAYGDTVDSSEEFTAFLSAQGDGRAKPAADDVESENILRENLLAQAEETHRSLDSWVPPAGVEAIQIAGWGIDTVGGVEYTEEEATRCYSTGASAVPSCTGIGEYEPVYEPKFTVDGDKVVIAPSALALTETENVKRYWVDLFDNNKGLSINRKHKDLFEVDSVRRFISDTLTEKETSSLPEFMYASRPDDYEGAGTRIRASLYSPLDIHLYDDQGRHTGTATVTVDGHTVTVFEEGIPNSSYYEFGGRKYVGLPGGEPIRIEMHGYDTGSYTLKLEELRVTADGEEVVAHTTFADLPVSPRTTAALRIPETGLGDLPALSADYDGGGAGGEYSVIPVPNGSATLDTIPPEIVFGFDPLTERLALSGTDNHSDPAALAVSVGEREAMVADEAGNRATATFDMNEAGNQIKFTLGSIAYGDMDAADAPAGLKYEWSPAKSGGVRTLNELATIGTMRVHAHYLAKDDVTVIEREDGGVTTRETRDGLVILRLVTKEGKIKISY